MSYNQFSSPVFIGGLFKSGTSLLRTMLAQHSDISSGLETFWFDIDWAYEQGRDETTLTKKDRLEARRTQPLHDRLSALCAYFDIDENTFLPPIFDEKPAGEEILSRLMETVCTREKTSRWLEKTPGNLLH